MWPPEFLAGQENLTSGLPEPSAAPSGESVPDLIARVTADADHPVVLYAVAPLTNVARALEEHPSLASDLERIVIMGGAVNVSGNVQGTNSEWNVWIDVPAASAVFTSGAPITLVPLDAANDVPVPSDHRRVLSEANQTDAIVYLSGLLDLFPSATSDFYFMWDELAASVASGEPTVTTEPMTIAVVVGGDDDGRTLVTDGGHEIEVSTGVDAPGTFYAIFVSVLSAAQE
jgi:inosine-uridine nucleoside N-ribohydrolase